MKVGLIQVLFKESTEDGSRQSHLQNPSFLAVHLTISFEIRGGVFWQSIAVTHSITHLSWRGHSRFSHSPKTSRVDTLSPIFQSP